MTRTPGRSPAGAERLLPGEAGIDRSRSTTSTRPACSRKEGDARAPSAAAARGTPRAREDLADHVPTASSSSTRRTVAETASGGLHAGVPRGPRALGAKRMRKTVPRPGTLSTLRGAPVSPGRRRGPRRGEATTGELGGEEGLEDPSTVSGSIPGPVVAGLERHVPARTQGAPARAARVRGRRRHRRTPVGPRSRSRPARRWLRPVMTRFMSNLRIWPHRRPRGASRVEAASTGRSSAPRPRGGAGSAHERVHVVGRTTMPAPE